MSLTDLMSTSGPKGNGLQLGKSWLASRRVGHLGSYAHLGGSLLFGEYLQVNINNVSTIK